MAKTKLARKRSLAATFADNAVIGRALKTAVKDAVEMHRRAGNKIAVMHEGKIVKIDPRKIST